jgi:hypothetical protein
MRVYKPAISKTTVNNVSEYSTNSAVMGALVGIRIVVGSKTTKQSSSNQETIAPPMRYPFLLCVAAIPVATPRMASTIVRDNPISFNPIGF